MTFMGLDEYRDNGWEDNCIGDRTMQSTTVICWSTVMCWRMICYSHKGQSHPWETEIGRKQLEAHAVIIEANTVAEEEEGGGRVGGLRRIPEVKVKKLAEAPECTLKPRYNILKILN